MIATSRASLLRAIVRRRALMLSAVALVMGAATPAAALVCSSSGEGHLVSSLYDFSYLSRREGTPAAPRATHFVRNNHHIRGVTVRWLAAGLNSSIPPLQCAYRTGWFAWTAPPHLRPLEYGASRTIIQVLTFAGLDTIAPGWPPSRPAPNLFRLAALPVPPERPVPGPDAGRARETAALLFLPVGTLPPELARDPLGPRLIDWIESHPDRLRPFSLAFESRVENDREGRATVALTFNAQIPPDASQLYLRFSDPLLQRLFFRSDAPVSLGGVESGRLSRAASLPAMPPAALAPRAAWIEILLGARGPVVAAAGIDYSAPRGY